MATYSNQHWLLSHIRNSFISTDDTGMCETVMASDDLPKCFLSKFQTAGGLHLPQLQRKSINSNCGVGSSSATGNNGKACSIDQPLKDVDFVCYPGLDQSDDEDMDLTAQSFDIQMYPEVGAYRFRSNTAQKLEKMDIARRKAARTKCVNYDDEIIGQERNDLFVRKPVKVHSRRSDEGKRAEKNGDEANSEFFNRDDLKLSVKSKLSIQLANSPKQTQNKFMEYARFDGTSQTGIQTKRINVFLNMLPEKDRNYPIKICVVASAKISEVIGFVCYKATIQFPTIPLKSIRHYALYMTEDNDDLEDFPPLDNREPCSKFGFSHLTLAERRPLAPVTRIDYHQNNPLPLKSSVILEEDKTRLDIASILQSSDLSVSSANADASNPDKTIEGINYEEHMFSHNEMLEAPMYRTYRLHIIDKRFFRTDVTLGISGERIEIDQHKNAKFWSKQKAVTYPIDAIVFCEIVERRNLKSVLRIWLKSSSSSSGTTNEFKSSSLSSTCGTTKHSANKTGTLHSPTSPGHYPTLSTPFAMFSNSGTASVNTSHQHSIRFKHYNFETDLQTAEHIVNKLNYILNVRSSEIRREFLQIRERKQEKNQAKKQLKMF